MQKKQAQAPAPCHFGAEAFLAQKGTTVRWLGGAGALINCQGYIILIDPVLKGFDLPVFAQPPIAAESIPHVDAVLLTHSDGDHFSVETCRDLRTICDAVHAPRYVAGLAEEIGMRSIGHAIGDRFCVGPVDVTVTPVDHTWQNDVPGAADRVFQKEDCCGFWLDTPDGTIWAIGDSRLMEEHLHMPVPDLMLFDFSDDSWHIGLENAVKLADTYPDTPLLLWHWGCIDAPKMAPFNANPDDLKARIRNPQRALVLSPGQPLTLTRLNA